MKTPTADAIVDVNDIPREQKLETALGRTGWLAGRFGEKLVPSLEAAIASTAVAPDSAFCSVREAQQSRYHLVGLR